MTLACLHRVGRLLGPAVLLALGCGPSTSADDGGTGSTSADAGGTNSSGASSDGTSSSVDTSEATGPGGITSTTQPLPPLPPCGIVSLAYIAHEIGGFAIDGAAVRDAAGASVSGGSDINGDGIPDVVVGAPGADPDGVNDAGSSYVVFGKADTDKVSLHAVAMGSGGFAIDGEEEHDWSGSSVSAAGDVNGDGLEDVVLGVFTAGDYAAGRAYVVFGRASTTRVSLGDVAHGNGGFVMYGESSSDDVGASASGAGDVNGDGLEDIIVGAPSATNNDRPNAGRSYVVFGKTDTDEVRLADIAVGHGGGFAIDGADAGDGSGSPVSAAGDINGDGLADVIVSAPEAESNGREAAGRVFVVFGKTDTDNVDLADVALGIGGFVMDGGIQDGHAGSSVSAPGDVNGDGILDIIVAVRATWDHPDAAGQTYVVFGKEDTDPVELSSVAVGIGGFIIRGEAQGDWSGCSLSGAGDVNDDGLADVIVGASGADPNDHTRSGRTYVVFGKADTDTVQLSDVAQGIGGFAIDGEAQSDYSGGSVSGAGDINGDGIPDIIVGAGGADPNGDGSGRAYVVFGGDFSCGE